MGVPRFAEPIGGGANDRTQPRRPWDENSFGPRGNRADVPIAR